MKPLEKIKLLIEEILTRMNVSGYVDVLESAENVQFSIRTEDAGMLIGENGQNLVALNHLVKRIAEYKLNGEEMPFLPFSIDVNDYQARRMEELRDLAKMHAQRVRYFKKEITMEPMNSYERRIVHSALSNYPDITTQSVGEDPGRRIVIKPLNFDNA